MISAIRPSNDVIPPSLMGDYADNTSPSNSSASSSDNDDWKPTELKESKISQAQLDELIKAPYLTKEDSCLMASMLKKIDVLCSEVNISTYKNRDVNFRKFFDENFEYSMVYCKDIEGLLNELHFYSNVNLDWWLFIDGSVNSIKAVLLLSLIHI